MNRVLAFAPKVRPTVLKPAGESTQVAPLKSLPQDQALVRGFEFALRSVLSGNFTDQDQLQALVNPRFIGDYLACNGVCFRDASGNGIRRDSLRGLQLSLETIPLLLAITNERRGAIDGANLANNQIKGFEFALRNVLSGNFTDQDQLQALVNPSFIRDYLACNGVCFRDASGNGIRRDSLRGLQLSQETIPLLLAITNERRGAIDGANLANNQIKGFEFALRNVLSGNFTDQDQLQALVNPRFIGDYLACNEVCFKDASRNGIRRDSLNGARLSEDAFAILNRIRNGIRSGTINPEFCQNLSTYLETGDEANLRRMIIMTSETQSAEIQTLVSDIINDQRTTKLRAQIYGGIVAGQAPDDLLRLTNEFQQQNLTETTLVARLQAAIRARVIRNKVEEASALLQGGNINGTLALAVGLLGEKTPEENQAGFVLARSAYRLELANFRREIFDKISQGLAIDEGAIRSFIEAAPKRASIGDLDYIAELLACQNRTEPILEGLIRQRAFAKATGIREGFDSSEPQEVIDTINSFPVDTPEVLAIRAQLTEFYRTSLAATRPGFFDAQIAPQIREATKARLIADFIKPNLGDNKAAADYLLGNFTQTMYLLAETLRADPATESQISRFLGQDSVIKFTQRLIDLEKQRDLTDIEREYIRSVERLTEFNPYLVACATVSPGATIEFLRQHFEKVSQATIAGLQDNDYIPAVQIGLGPNGLVSLGEILRNNPALASSLLVVDAGKQPGGPFAIPEGPAWELNSANGRGEISRVMPAPPGSDEIQTVRAYGSPVARWYPGERISGADVRAGSINTTVDYLPTPDDISTARYPTNEELALVLSLQAAMVTNKIALQTKFVKLEKNPDGHSAGDKILTLEISDGQNKRQIRLRTDAVLLTNGLGDDGYGFELAGTRAEKIVEATKDLPLPKVTKTLQAFRALASRFKKPMSLGRTVVIYGRGNSADTLLEYIGSIFKGDNSNVRNIEKVYVICDGNLSTRPRYSQINDLRPRNGRGNFIEQVRGRVQDIDFVSQEGDLEKRQLCFYDKNGALIKDDRGNDLVADFAIAATGFRSRLDEVLSAYAAELGTNTDDPLRMPLTLPTDSKVAVAEMLAADPSVLILGTASKPGFDATQKLAQLPRDAREALLRNGAENAVAIGFRGPDTQAAINIWLNGLDVSVDPQPSVIKRNMIMLNGADDIEADTSTPIDQVIKLEDIVVPTNIQDERSLLTPIFVYNVANSVELNIADDNGYTGSLDFTLSLNSEKQLELRNSSKISRELAGALKRSCEDKDFQNYALAALIRKRRANRSLAITLCFNKGRLVPSESFVES